MAIPPVELKMQQREQLPNLVQENQQLRQENQQLRQDVQQLTRLVQVLTQQNQETNAALQLLMMRSEEKDRKIEALTQDVNTLKRNQKKNKGLSLERIATNLAVGGIGSLVGKAFTGFNTVVNENCITNPGLREEVLEGLNFGWGSN